MVGWWWYVCWRCGGADGGVAAGWYAAALGIQMDASPTNPPCCACWHGCSSTTQQGRPQCRPATWFTHWCCQSHCTGLGLLPTAVPKMPRASDTNLHFPFLSFCFAPPPPPPPPALEWKPAALPDKCLLLSQSGSSMRALLRLCSCSASHTGTSTICCGLNGPYRSCSDMPAQQRDHVCVL
jgi:hypothetical protein